MKAYSHRIHHAFSFAAKHHADQVRKGSKTPYVTHPANVAVILARYGCDEDTIVAGILHDVIEDCVSDAYPRGALEQRIAAKFGTAVLETVLAVTHVDFDEQGTKLDNTERKARYLEHLAVANESARWVCAADKIHNGNALLSDLSRADEAATVWRRFKGSPAETVAWYRNVHARLLEVGFAAPIVEELRGVVEQLQRTLETPAER